MVGLSGGQQTVSGMPRKRADKRWKSRTYSMYDLDCFLRERRCKKE